MKKFSCSISNFLIFLSTIKETILFFMEIKRFQKIQGKKRVSLFERNKDSAYFNSLTDKTDVPLSTWSNYEQFIKQIIIGEQNVLSSEKVILLEPTSGTTAPTKYIPYTKNLQKEFNKAIQPWLAGIYITWPKLLFSTQYWSISPEALTETQTQNRSIAIGFEQDSQYLGKGRSGILNKIMTVPAEIKYCLNHENWAYLTVFFLLQDSNLGLVSIWHPSFFTILMDKIKIYYHILIDDIEKGCQSPNPILNSFSGYKKLKPRPGRAFQLRELDINSHGVFKKIWPKLQVISCWADNPDEPCLIELQRNFPNTFIQPKGLIATEGIVSFPFGRIFGIPAFRSHCLEFIDVEDESIKKMEQLEKDHKYEVVISTGCGLYRYRMNDIVLVKGFYKSSLPLFQFLYKRDYISDIRGEKISLQHVVGLQTELIKLCSGTEFMMLGPVVTDLSAYYTCFVYFKSGLDIPFLQMANVIDDYLKQNFHYRYARQIGQLEPIKIYKLNCSPVETIINHIESTGTKRGDIKLYPLSTIVNWHEILAGAFVN